MAIHTFQPARPLAADGAELGRALQRARAAKTDLIRVTGPAGLTAMLWLCRNGYERAVFVRPGSVAAQAPADALLIPHACGLGELTEVLGRGDSLREGGALIVQTAASESPESQSLILEPLGYRVEHRLSDRGRSVLIARRCGIGGFKKAA